MKSILVLTLLCAGAALSRQFPPGNNAVRLGPEVTIKSRSALSGFPAPRGDLFPQNGGGERKSPGVAAI